MLSLSELFCALRDSDVSGLYIGLYRVNELGLFVDHCCQILEDGVDVHNVGLEESDGRISNLTDTNHISFSMLLRNCQ